MRCTVSLLTPKRLASLRHDQWVEPSLRPFLIAANIRACSLGVRTDGFCPGCRSSISPAILCRRNCSFPREIVGAVVSKTSSGKGPSLSSSVRRSHHITCRKTPRLRHLLQFLSFFLVHNNRSSPEWHANEALNLR